MLSVFYFSKKFTIIAHVPPIYISIECLRDGLLEFEEVTLLKILWSYKLSKSRGRRWRTLDFLSVLHRIVSKTERKTYSSLVTRSYLAIFIFLFLVGKISQRWLDGYSWDFHGWKRRKIPPKHLFFIFSKFTFGRQMHVCPISGFFFNILSK